MVKIRSIKLISRPTGTPKPSDFQISENDVDLSCQDGQVHLKVEYLSVDPYMRPKMDDNRGSYTAPYELNQPMVGGGVARVFASKSSEFAVNDLVLGFLPWVDQQVVTPKDVGLRKLDVGGFPPSYFLGVLGMPGLTAYAGFLEICQPKEGESLLVTGAAGAVGCLVGQIGKIHGCRVVGTAGSDDKVQWLKSLGFDEVINYKTTPDLGKALKDAFPKGIDCFFDNVGGETFDAAMPLMNVGGRVSLCGSVSGYNSGVGKAAGPRVHWQCISKGLKLQGFIVGRDFGHKQPEFAKQMPEWLRDGKVKYQETVVHGFENTPQALIDMLGGKNTGKMIVKA